MATLHGELILKSADNSDQFFQLPILNATVNNDLQKKLLNDPAYINGFSGGKDSSLVEDMPQQGLIPLELEEGNQTIKAIYKDAGAQNSQYDVIVYFLVEEAQ